jgi:hypothetical protein
MQTEPIPISPLEEAIAAYERSMSEAIAAQNDKDAAARRAHYDRMTQLRDEALKACGVEDLAMKFGLEVDPFEGHSTSDGPAKFGVELLHDSFTHNPLVFRLQHFEQRHAAHAQPGHPAGWGFFIELTGGAMVGYAARPDNVEHLEDAVVRLIIKARALSAKEAEKVAAKEAEQKEQQQRSDTHKRLAALIEEERDRVAVYHWPAGIAARLFLVRWCTGVGGDPDDPRFDYESVYCAGSVPSATGFYESIDGRRVRPSAAPTVEEILVRDTEQAMKMGLTELAHVTSSVAKKWGSYWVPPDAPQGEVYTHSYRVPIAAVQKILNEELSLRDESPFT